MKGLSAPIVSFQEKLNRFLDNDMTNEEKLAFVSEIQKHPELNKRLQQEKAFHDFLRSTMQRRPIPQGLVDNIKSKIRL